MRRPRPVEHVVRGFAAGLAGTAAMTVWQQLARPLQDEPPADGESDPWESAPAPAQVAKRLIEGLFGRPVPPERIGLLTHVAHWAYGTAWGGAYALVRGANTARPLSRGLLFGTGVWAMSYAELVPTGIYRPPWEYPPKTLALDLSYHLVYGVGVAAAHAAVDAETR